MSDNPYQSPADWQTPPDRDNSEGVSDVALRICIAAVLGVFYAGLIVFGIVAFWTGE